MDHRPMPGSTNSGCLERAIDAYLNVGIRVLTYVFETPEGRRALKGGLRGCCLPLLIGAGGMLMAAPVWARAQTDAPPGRFVTRKANRPAPHDQHPGPTLASYCSGHMKPRQGPLTQSKSVMHWNVPGTQRI